MISEIIELPSSAYKVLNYLLMLIIVFFLVAFVLNWHSLLPYLSPSQSPEFITFYWLNIVTGIAGLIGLVAFVLVKIYRVEY